MSNALVSLSSKLAERFGMGAESDVIAVLRATAFKGPATDAQLVALMVVAQQYSLNPFTKELYAFPDKNNGIVPVVGVDGWARIINTHEQFDGLDFEQDSESCTCIIHRKDRSHPTRVTEYMAECRRDVGPWKSHPYRMLRHKALIQCARLAFGFVGIFDQDEAERIVEQPAPVTRPANVVEAAPAELIQAADDAAAKGVAAYQGFWSETGAGNRKALASGHETRKQAAVWADAARTVEAPAAEVAAA